MEISPKNIRDKFGDDYMADDRTFVMDIDRRFTKHFAERFVGMNVLETCTGETKRGQVFILDRKYGRVKNQDLTPSFFHIEL